MRRSGEGSGRGRGGEGEGEFGLSVGGSPQSLRDCLVNKTSILC